MAYVFAGRVSTPAQPNTIFRVYIKSTGGVATLYETRTKAITKPDAYVTSDDQGMLTFFVDPGEYSLIVRGNDANLSAATRTEPDFDITVRPDPAEIDLTHGGQGVVVTNTTSAASKTLDISAAAVIDQKLTVATTTFIFSTPPASGTAESFILVLRQDTGGGRLVTWPTSVKWNAATAPTLSTGASAIDLFEFITIDGGVTYFAAILAQGLG